MCDEKKLNHEIWQARMQEFREKRDAKCKTCFLNSPPFDCYGCSEIDDLYYEVFNDDKDKA